jgi:prepilin-type N-terminal cleavage/methylation domain-containing protein
MIIKNNRKSAAARITSEDGLSLLEIVIALVIISITGLYFMSYISYSSSYSADANQKMTAGHLAKLTLRQYQAMDFDNDLEQLTTLGEQTVAAADVLPAGYPVDFNPGLYTVRVRVFHDQSLAADMSAELIFIEVRVSWDAQKSMQLKGSVNR